MANGTKKHIFISYTREDLPRVEKISKILRDRNFEVWFDNNPEEHQGLQPGQPWKYQIYHAIDTSFAFLILFSKHTDSRERIGIYPELDRAIAWQMQLPPSGSFIFPIVLDNAQVPSVEINNTQDLRSLQITYLDGPAGAQRKEWANLFKVLKEKAPNQETSRQEEISEIEALPPDPRTFVSTLLGHITGFLTGFSEAFSTVGTTKRGRERLFYSVFLLFFCLILGSWFNTYFHSNTTGSPDTLYFNEVPWVLFLTGTVLIWKPRSSRAPKSYKVIDEPEQDTIVPKEQEQSEQARQAESNTRKHRRIIKELNSKLFENRQIIIGLKRSLKELKNKEKELRRQIPEVIFWSMIWSSLCCWLSFYPLQGNIQNLNYKEYDEPIRGIIFFSGTVVSMILFAIASFFLAYQRQRRMRTNKLKLSSMIALGAFLSGIVWILNTTPEVYSMLVDRKNYEVANKEYFSKWSGVSLFHLLVLTKLVVIPFVGAIAALIAPSVHKTNN